MNRNHKDYLHGLCGGYINFKYSLSIWFVILYQGQMNWSTAKFREPWNCAASSPPPTNTTCGNASCCSWFLATQIWWGRKFQLLHIHMKCLDVRIRVFQIEIFKSAAFELWSVLNCGASFNQNSSETFLTSTTFRTKKLRKFKSFRFLRIKLFSRNPLAALSIGVSIDNLLVKSYITAEQCIYFFATEAWAKRAKFWMLVWFVLIINIAFPQRDRLYLFRQVFNQLLIFTGLVNFRIFFHPFLENLISLTYQDFCICMMLLRLRSTFSWATGCIFSSRQILFFEQFWNVTLYVILLQLETWLAENPKIWICMCFFLRFQLISPNYRLDFFHQSLSGHL